MAHEIHSGSSEHHNYACRMNNIEPTNGTLAILAIAFFCQSKIYTTEYVLYCIFVY